MTDISDDARVVLTTKPAAAADAIAIRLVATPTTKDLAAAIRDGLAGVARWPGPIEPLLAQLARVWRRS